MSDNTLPPLPKGPHDKDNNEGDQGDQPNHDKTIISASKLFSPDNPAPLPSSASLDPEPPLMDAPVELPQFMYPVTGDDLPPTPSDQPDPESPKRPDASSESGSKNDASSPERGRVVAQPLPSQSQPSQTPKPFGVSNKNKPKNRQGLTAEDIRNARRNQMRQHQDVERIELAAETVVTDLNDVSENRVADRGTLQMSSPDVPNEPSDNAPIAPKKGKKNKKQKKKSASESESESEYVRPDTIIIKTRPRRNCLGRAIALGSGFSLLGVALMLIALTAAYIWIASSLPPVSELDERLSDFETGHIYDSKGGLLYTITDRDTGNRTYVPLNQINQYVIDATIATEDVRFYSHPGFDPIAIGRAVLSAATSRSFTGGGGASTITQQVVRNLMLSDEEASQRTAMRKIREIILAAELQRTEDRDKILEVYLNEIYYGNRAYGIEAAAQTYFNKSAATLTLAESSLLAGLPQAPAWWDPVTAPELAEGRQWEVLTLMNNHGKVEFSDAQNALNERIAYQVDVQPISFRYPHYTLAVLGELEQRFGSELHRGGYNIYTTIDPDLQEMAEQTMVDNRANVNKRGANNASLVALDPKTGAILSMVGSFDFGDEGIDGQINMNRAPRQPGSTIKPFVYLAVLENGGTPATMYWDVPSRFPNGNQPAYEPQNFDREFHGPLHMRYALANSYNIPAVKALETVGLCPFILRAQHWGINYDQTGCATIGNPTNYGLSMSLGGGATTPLEMANAYQMLANNGQILEPFAITRIENKSGEVVFDHAPSIPTRIIDAETGEEEQVTRTTAENAFLMSDMLSDNEARLLEFEENNFLEIGNHAVAAKTGTSGTNDSDVRDGWTAGYTSDLVTVVWVGNTDNTPLAKNANGYRTASPIWQQFMENALALPAFNGDGAHTFTPTSESIQHEICKDSGTFRTPDCDDNNRRTEWFARENPPLPNSDHFIRRTELDAWTLRIANDKCNDEPVITVKTFNLLTSGTTNEIKNRYRREAEAWLTEDGSWWAAQRNVRFPLPDGQKLLLDQECEVGTARPQVQIIKPSFNTLIDQPTVVTGIANAPGFAGYQLEYGEGENPKQFFPLHAFQTQPATNGTIAVISPDDFNFSGAITLRLTVFGPDNPYTQDKIDRPSKKTRVVVIVPEPTPLPPTATPFPTKTPRFTPTIAPTGTPAPVLTPTNVPTDVLETETVEPDAAE